MSRREFSTHGLAGVAFAATGSAALGMQEGGASTAAVFQPMHSEAWQDCAKACSECQRICDACATHCASMLFEGKKEHAVTLMSCRDCADICATAAQVAARGGIYARNVCEACAQICADCGRECNKFSNDSMMKQCAEECFDCEKACRAMVSRDQ